MISRYSRPEAVALWSQETKYSIWFEIEAHAPTKMDELGTIPASAAEAICPSSATRAMSTAVAKMEMPRKR